MFIYKYAYGSSYSINKKGICNSSFVWKSRYPLDYEKSALPIHNYLKDNDVKVYNKDYLEITSMAKKGDYVFLDPPYQPTRNNRKYYSIGDHFDQDKLKEEVDRLTALGVHIRLTNSEHPYIRELYKDYKITELSISRTVDNYAVKVNETELLISNEDLLT